LHLNYKGHLKSAIPNPPVALEISSDVFDFNCDFALLCAAFIKSSLGFENSNCFLHFLIVGGGLKSFFG